MRQLNRMFRREARRWWTVAALVLLLAAAVGPASPAQAESVPQVAPQRSGLGRFEKAACMFSVPASLKEGENLQCGWLTVPEQYGNPNGPTIQLAVAIIKSTSPSPQPDPLVMLQGGPGGSTIDTYTQLIPLDPRLRRLDRDIILFDQRGTLYSKPALTCSEYDEMTVRTLNVDLTKEEGNQKQLEALKACHDRLVQEGVNLSAFDSLENAADVDALRQALGYQQINLYGVSYGTLLALHVLRQFPSGLRSVIIDSVVPPQTNFILDAPRSENRSLEAVFTACAQDKTCNSAYPNLKQVFYDTVDKLNAKKAHVTVTDFKSGKSYPALLDGDTLLGVFVQMLYQTDVVPLVPRVMYEARAGNYSFVEKILSLVVFDRTMSYGMYFSVLCAEDADFSPQDYNLSGLPKQMAASEQDSAQEFLKTCQAWQVQPLGPQADQPVSSDVPTLVLSGAFDPITPPAYAQEAAKTLSNSYFFEFPIGGHGEVTSGECQDSIFMQFLDNPRQKPDGACVSQQKMIFSTPGALVRIPVLPNLLNLQGMAGVQLGLYGLALLFLLTALLVYPLVWLVRLLRGNRQPALQPVTSPQSTTPLTTYPYVPPRPEPLVPQRRPWLYRLAPWLASLTALSLLVFIGVLAGVALSMALKNDSRVLLGLPGSARPLFLLPVLALIMAVLMLMAALIAWARRAGTMWGRVYFSLLTGAAWVCVIILGLWGMLSAIFRG